MRLRYLILTNFKSYRSAKFEFADKLNLIYGLNGMGKTNLLDAIFCLAMTQSNFKIPDQLLIHEGEQFYRLEGGISRDHADYKLVIKSQKRRKKIVEKNRVPYKKLAEHIGFMPIVMIAPDDIELITGGNAIRRRLLDRTISQVDSNYLSHSIDYTRLQKQRNALLKQFQEGRRYDEVLLSTYDQKMSPHAEYIYQARNEFLTGFIPELKAVYTKLSNGQEDATIRYQNQIENSNFLAVTKSNRPRDRAMGRTSTGPHADKLIFELDGKEMKSFASQGQKKSAIFAAKIAQYQYLAKVAGIQPILLLDDIFDRLDHDRVNRLVDIILKDTFGQIFITDIEASRVDAFFEQANVSVNRIKIGNRD